MKEDKISLAKLDIINGLMSIYKMGTGNDINHKDENGKYAIVEFIKQSQPLLKEIGHKFTLENDHKFIEDFFELMFKHKECQK